jgi:nicotinamide phosphoribosyltransferase
MGMGGGLLQEVNRDTQKMACKASLIRVNGQYREIYKDPVTDPGKASRGGKLDLIRGVNGQFETVAIPPGLAQASDSQLITFYETGKCLVDQTVSEIRKRAWSEYL